MLRVRDITFSIGGRTLFENASAHIPAGHRVGFLGANGSGKTTLLRLVLGEAELDGGNIQLRAKARVGIVAQDAPGGDTTPLDAVLAADEELCSLQAEALTAQDPHRIAEIHTRLDEIGAGSAPSRAAAVLGGLGFSEADQHRPLKHFSGGWRMRVALAAVLFSAPDLLLLDEPTNHLDLEAAEWLKGFLKSYPNTLLMVSHDRDFLSTTVNSILHLSGTQLEMFSGGYEDFLRVRAERSAHTEAARAKQAAARKRMEDFVNRFRAKATKAKQAQSRLKMLERMSPIEAGPMEKKVRFQFPEPAPASSPLVRLDDVSVGYTPDNPILEHLSLSVFDEDRIALLGRNGNGKTTFARLISGELTPSAGEIFRTAKLKVGYFAQDHLERLNPERTAVEQLHGMLPDASVTEVRSRLGAFGLGEDNADVPCGLLSGGEKTRLALCLAVLERPNLLILDEPTNHLDIASRQALLDALNEFRGAVILVSHDRHLLDGCADRLWLIQDGEGRELFGDLDDYIKELEATRRREKQSGNDNAEGEKVNRRQQRKEAADLRAKIAPLKKNVEAAEGRMVELQREKDDVEAELSNPAVYEGDPAVIQGLTRRRAELEAALADAETAWLEAEEALETATADAETAGVDGDNN